MSISLLRAIILAAALGFAGAGGASGQVVTEGLSVEFGRTKLHLDRIEAEGTPLSAADLTRLFDPKDAATLDARLARVAAQRLRIPEIRVQSDQAGEEIELLYRDVTLEGVGAGRAESLRAAALDTRAGPKSAPRAVSHQADIWLKRVDLRQFARALTGARADDHETPKTIAEEASIGALSLRFSQPDMEIRAKEARVAGLSARPLAQPLLRLGAEAPAAGVALALADALGAAEARALEAHEIEATASDPAAAARYGLKVKRLAIEGFAGAKARSLAVEDARLDTADGGHFTLAALAVEGADLKALAAQEGWRALRVERLRANNLAADLPDAASGGRLDARIESFALDLGEIRAGLPTKLSLRLDRYVDNLAARAAAPAAEQLSALGYQRLVLSARLDASWREEGQELQINRLQATSENMCALDLEASLRGVSLPALAASPLAANLALLGMRATRLEARLDATPLIDRILAREAKGARADAAKQRAAYALDAGAAVTGLLKNGDKARRLGDAVAKAIEQRKKLRINLSASQGVGALDALKGPAGLLEEIEVEAAVE